MKEMSESSWKLVPSKVYPRWSAIFEASQEILTLSAACPICGKTSLHRYYLPQKAIDKTLKGIRFVAHGDLWEWCSSCKHYLHATSLIPEWWSCNLPVDPSKLTHDPEIIEQAIHRTAGSGTGLRSSQGSAQHWGDQSTAAGTDAAEVYPDPSSDR